MELPTNMPRFLDEVTIHVQPDATILVYDEPTPLGEIPQAIGVLAAPAKVSVHVCKPAKPDPAYLTMVRAVQSEVRRAKPALTTYHVTLASG